jgi:hypothetical protein
LPIFSENERFMLIGKLAPVMCGIYGVPLISQIFAEIFHLKVRGRFFVAAGGPAFRYKSSLRSGLTAAIRLKNKVSYCKCKKIFPLR